ncbi:hypothetical protein PLICRDRAFT_231091 [Plicaturopsis crispa FD-325 SS-3]|nr:hypothetical protein PLICRDRAFT_231091 [Plicaturopsis crispa FD-325 SS-3]
MLKRQLGTTLTAISARKEEDLKIRSMLIELKQDVEKLRQEGEQRDRTRALAEHSIRGDLRLLSEDKHRISAHQDILRDLGTSLADIAAFKHKIELQQGIAPSSKAGADSTDRLRSIALRMQGLRGPDGRTQS